MRGLLAHGIMQQPLPTVISTLIHFGYSHLLLQLLLFFMLSLQAQSLSVGAVLTCSCADFRVLPLFLYPLSLTSIPLVLHAVLTFDCQR